MPPRKRKNSVETPEPTPPALNSMPKKGMTNTHVALSLALLCVAGGLAFLATGKNIDHVAAQTSVAPPACAVAKFEVSQECQKVMGSSARCADGASISSGKSCYTAEEWQSNATAYCTKRRSTIQTVTVGTEPCATRYFSKADYSCTQPVGGTATSATITARCQTATMLLNNVVAVCKRVSCAVVPVPPVTSTTTPSGIVTVSKNNAYADRSSSNPTGAVNTVQAKVGSFIITAPSQEDVQVTHVTVRDDTTNTCAGTYLQNLKLTSSNSTDQIAPIIPSPSPTCATQNSYIFTLSSPMIIPRGTNYEMNLLADLKAAMTTSTSLLDVDKVTAIGVTSSNSANAENINLSLQRMYISNATGAFSVTVDADSPFAASYLLGSTNHIVGKFRFTAGTDDGVIINQLTVQGREASATARNVWTNLRLVDTDTGIQIGQPIPSFSGTAQSPQATFSGFNITIPKNTSKVLGLKVDFVAFSNAGITSTGQTLSPGISSVVAAGAASGSAIPITPNVYASRVTTHRVKLSVAWASDTPKGTASPEPAQTIAKFIVSNSSNAGSYTATINSMNFEISSTIGRSQTTSPTGATSTVPRILTIYKDSNQIIQENLLGTYTLRNPNTLSETTYFADNQFTNVDIASGQSKTFYAKLDTMDATSTKSLSVRLRTPWYGIDWSDGAANNISSEFVDGLSTMQFKTFTY